MFTPKPVDKNNWVIIDTIRSTATPLDREPPVVPKLEDIENLVRQDLKRRRGDDALRDYLANLRTKIPVAVDESLFE